MELDRNRKKELGELLIFAGAGLVLIQVVVYNLPAALLGTALFITGLAAYMRYRIDPYRHVSRDHPLDNYEQPTEEDDSAE
jgi:membrane-bound ClpP family serine protease